MTTLSASPSCDPDFDVWTATTRPNVDREINSYLATVWGLPRLSTIEASPLRLSNVAWPPGRLRQLAYDSSLTTVATRINLSINRFHHKRLCLSSKPSLASKRSARPPRRLFTVPLVSSLNPTQSKSQKLLFVHSTLDYLDLRLGLQLDSRFQTPPFGMPVYRRR